MIVSLQTSTPWWDQGTTTTGNTWSPHPRPLGIDTRHSEMWSTSKLDKLRHPTSSPSPKRWDNNQNLPGLNRTQHWGTQGLACASLSDYITAKEPARWTYACQQSHRSPERSTCQIYKAHQSYYPICMQIPACSTAFCFSKVSEVEVVKKLSNLDAGKANGLDRIAARLLCMVAPSIAPSITSLFIASLVTGHAISIRMEGSKHHTCT